MIEHAFRPLLASVGAVGVAVGVYGTHSQCGPDSLDAALATQVEQAADDAITLVRGFDRT